MPAPEPRRVPQDDTLMADAPAMHEILDWLALKSEDPLDDLIPLRRHLRTVVGMPLQPRVLLRLLDLFEPRRGQAFMKAEELEARVRQDLPGALRALPFKIDMAQQDPRPLNPIQMRDRQLYVYDSASRTVSAEPLKELLKYLPGKVAQCRIFAATHEHDAALAQALERALSEERPAHPTNL